MGHNGIILAYFAQCHDHSLWIKCQYRNAHRLPVYSCDITSHVITMPTKTCMNIPSNLRQLDCQHKFKGQRKRQLQNTPLPHSPLPHPLSLCSPSFTVLIGVETGGSNQLITHKGKSLQSVEGKQSNTLFCKFVQALQISCAWKL